MHAAPSAHSCLLCEGTRRAFLAGNLVSGEHKHAIPARVPAKHIKRVGQVVESSAGVPVVPRTSWRANENWEPCFCRYSLSECEDVQCH